MSTSRQLGIPAIDLFAGAGGLSVGAANAGVSVRAHIDNDMDSCASLRTNPRWHQGEVIEQDVTTLDGQTLRTRLGLTPSDPLLVMGGAPCQPFSKAAYWTEAGDDAAYRRARSRGEKLAKPAPPTLVRPDARRDLVHEFWRIVMQTRADAFVFENVPSLLHPRNRHLALDLLDAARAQGFKPVLVKANAVHYGVAQKRERVFILATRHAEPEPPVPTHSSAAEAGLNFVTAGEAIAKYAGAEYFEAGEVVAGRYAEHLRTIPPGWNYKAHTAWGGHPNPSFETETRFWSFLLKLSPDLPSWTVPANPGPWVGPFHWDSRRLRTPELAALQGFPDGYVFSGERRSRVRQIGNAVPPLLAQRMVGATVAAMLEGATMAAQVA